VVVGAGPAGLASSIALADRGVDHVVLERGLAGQSWRTQRWDSFRLNNPGWMNPMLGEQPQNSYRWDLQTGEGLILARTVLVDTGGENVRRIPALARAIPGRVGQHHAADYRSPGGLPEGTVLVVGSAQSGTQIAEDLLAAGRHVILSTSPVGHAPARHRGRDTLQQLVECGFFAQRARDLPDQSVLSAPQPLIAPGGRSTSLRALARAGVTLTGRLVAVDDEHVTFDRSTAANVAAGDAFATRIRVRLDEILHRSNEPAPPIEPDQADLPIQPDPPLTLNLRADGIGAIVWCTGYTGDFSWLHPRLLDDPVLLAAAGSLATWTVPDTWALVRRIALAHPPGLCAASRHRQRRRDGRGRHRGPSDGQRFAARVKTTPDRATPRAGQGSCGWQSPTPGSSSARPTGTCIRSARPCWSPAPTKPVQPRMRSGRTADDPRPQR